MCDINLLLPKLSSGRLYRQRQGQKAHPLHAIAALNNLRPPRLPNLRQNSLLILFFSVLGVVGTTLQTQAQSSYSWTYEMEEPPGPPGSSSTPHPDWNNNVVEYIPGAGSGMSSYADEDHGFSDGPIDMGNNAGLIFAVSPGSAGSATSINSVTSYDLSTPGSSLTMTMGRRTGQNVASVANSNMPVDVDWGTGVSSPWGQYAGWRSRTEAVNEIMQIGIVDNVGGLLRADEANNTLADSIYVTAVETGFYYVNGYDQWETNHDVPPEDVSMMTTRHDVYLTDENGVFDTDAGTGANPTLNANATFLDDLDMRTDVWYTLEQGYAYRFDITFTSVDDDNNGTVDSMDVAMDTVYEYFVDNARETNDFVGSVMASTSANIPLGGLDASAVYPALGMYIDEENENSNVNSGTNYDWDPTVPIPEPGSAFLLGFSGISALFFRRRARRTR